MPIYFGVFSGIIIIRYLGNFIIFYIHGIDFGFFLFLKKGHLYILTEDINIAAFSNLVLIYSLPFLIIIKGISCETEIVLTTIRAR